jgi:O-antigen/teichoic acid export membrane protein
MTKNITSMPISALLSVSIRWIDRLVGFVSTLILARLLTPSDLGVIAMSSIVIGMVDVLLDLGVNIVLIQNQNATPKHFNAAWSLRIIQSCLAASVIYAAAYPAAEYFQEPHVIDVLHVLMFSPILASLENIGIVTYQKNMQFGLEFRYFFVKRIISFLATVTAAWFLRDFWALVIGTLVGRSTGAILSYIVHPMRPKFTLSGVKDIMSISTWLLLRGIGNYFNAEAHRLIVGHRVSTLIFGGYSLGLEIAAIPTTELMAPLSKVLFPAFVRVKDNMTELKRTYLLALRVQTLIGIPAGIGMVLVANELVLALLGEKWIAAAPFIQVFGIFNILGAINYTGGYLLLALNKAKESAAFTLMQIVIFLILVEFAFPDANALEVAKLRVAVGIFNLIPYSIYLNCLIPSIKIWERLACFWRPLIAASLMTATLYELPELVGFSVMIILIVKVILGATVYSLSILGLWLLASRPDGAESYLFEKLNLYKKQPAL